MMIQCSPVELYNYIRLIQWKNGRLNEGLEIHHFRENKERKGGWKVKKRAQNNEFKELTLEFQKFQIKATGHTRQFRSKR